MKVIFEPEFAKRKELVARVESATPLVEKLLAKAAVRMTANWNLFVDEHGNPQVQLTLADPLAGEIEASADFPADELQNAEDVREHLYRLWRKLMDLGFDRRLEFLKANAPAE